MLKLRITYCGGCNPEIDRGNLVERLYDLMQAEGLAFCPVPDYQTADVVLIVNGCAHACKEEELTTESFPFISVKGKDSFTRKCPKLTSPKFFLNNSSASPDPAASILQPHSSLLTVHPSFAFTHHSSLITHHSSLKKGTAVFRRPFFPITRIVCFLS